MDYLLESANTWEKLLNYKYVITYFFKGNIVEINIVFDKKDFYHLAGFQYITDIELPMVTRNSLLNAIKNEKITQQIISKSDNYERLILPRIKILYKLEKLLDGHFSFYKYNPKFYPFYTDINASFVISEIDSELKKFFFIIKTEQNKYHGCSIFEEGDKDFTVSQKRINFLKLEKINTLTKEKVILYENTNGWYLRLNR